MNTAWRIPKGGQIVQAVMPGDLSAAPIQGPWVTLANHIDLLVNMVLDTGTAAPVLAFEQATDAAGAGAVVLPISDISTLAAVDLNAPVAGEEWNEHDAIHRMAMVDSFDTTGTGGDTNAQFRVIVRIHQDIVTDGFTHVRLNSAALGGARQGAVEYIAAERAYQGNANSTM